MYSIGIAASLLGVCVKTLRRWDKSKKIACHRTIRGHRRFSIKEINRILNRKERDDRSGQEELDKTCAIYCWVSSHKQSKRGDLDRQSKLLKNYAKLNDFKLIRTYKDVGSGLNTIRKGLWRLIQDSKKNQFSTILISNYRLLALIPYYLSFNIIYAIFSNLFLGSYKIK